MNEIEKDMERISKAIHYPDCWDTMAYPTLYHALWEMVMFNKDSFCPTCSKPQGHIESLGGLK